MIAVAAAFVCVTLFPLVGGRVSSLTQFRLRHEGLVLALFLAQAVLRGRIPGGGEASDWAVFAWGVTGVVLIAVLLPSRRHTGVAILILGLAANLWVTLLNQGMPYVTADGARLSAPGSFYHPATAATSMSWMGDVLPDPTGRWLLSIGDLMLFVGVITLVLAASTQEADGKTSSQEKSPSMRID